MPSFKRKTIGDFVAGVQPTGRLRSFLLVRRLVPYFAGEEPKMRLAVAHVHAAQSSVKFSAELRSLPPGCEADKVAQEPFFSRRTSTPLKEEVTFPVLKDEGNYEYELTISSPDGRGGTAVVAVLPVTTGEVLFGTILGRLVLLIVGAAVGAGLGALVDHFLICPHKGGG